MTAPELKPCPFCGAPAEIEIQSDHHGQWFNLGCSRHWGKDRDKACHAGRLWYTETDIPLCDAIAAWNTRAPDPDLDAHIGAALAEAAECCTAELRNTAMLLSNPPQSSAAWDARNSILALRPTAITALDRAKGEARVEVSEQIWAAIERLHVEATPVDALNAIAPIVRAMIEKEGKP